MLPSPIRDILHIYVFISAAYYSTTNNALRSCGDGSCQHFLALRVAISLNVAPSFSDVCLTAGGMGE